ncbi:uncharacterized protein LOC142563744 [Dermacentor variabilis]|uniref:uncharacterized protein LOC142563744 n=1 Tax=Dermacentor variabilis TaxID=34621 RepID=UPI003F5CBC82
MPPAVFIGARPGQQLQAPLATWSTLFPRRWACFLPARHWPSLCTTTGSRRPLSRLRTTSVEGYPACCSTSAVLPTSPQETVLSTARIPWLTALAPLQLHTHGVLLADFAWSPATTGS